jgi:hypothetical protein
MTARPSKDIDSFSAERAGVATVADDLIGTRQQLLEVATAEHNPGFSTEMFVSRCPTCTAFQMPPAPAMHPAAKVGTSEPAQLRTRLGREQGGLTRSARLTAAVRPPANT